MNTALSLVSRPPILTMTASLAELQHMASVCSRGQAVDGGQDAIRIRDDLMILRSDVHSLPPLRLEFDVQDWLVLHFRIKGSSVDRYPDGRELSHDDGCFVVSACAGSGPLVRELLTDDDWRTVSILCPPSFVEREFGTGQLFRAVDAGTDFVYAGTLTSGMRAAAEALLHVTMPSGLRVAYMHTKAMELICLALQNIHEHAPSGPAIRLSRRDAECLHQARSLLCSLPRAPTLDELARHVGINRKKLALGFKQTFGVTVGEFDRAQRLDRARDLIEQGVHSIGHVAWLAGYADQGSFSKAFKARHGALPRETRVG